MTDFLFNASRDARSHRSRRMFEALILGASLDAISEEENLPSGVAETMVRDEIERRRVASVGEFAKIKIARLERLCVATLDRAQRGDLEAIDRALKVLDRLDRYHGFSRMTPAAQPYGEEERERLFAKINSMLARLEEDESAQ